MDIEYINVDTPSIHQKINSKQLPI